MTNGYFFAVMIMLFIASMAIARYAAKKRRDAMSAQAARMGFRYAPTVPGLMERLTALGDPFDRGSGSRARNVLTGMWDGRSATAFDYSYKTSSGKETKTHHLGIVCIDAQLDMPTLSVLPEGVLTRAMGALLGDDVQLESEDFNRAFRVTSDNRRFATDVLHPRTMQFLLANGREGFRLVDGQAIRVSVGTIEPLAIPGAMAYLDTILDDIPDHVRRGLGRYASGTRGEGLVERLVDLRLHNALHWLQEHR